MTGAVPVGAEVRALFEALRQVGLDRRRVSIHEMLTDILEVVAVAVGLKPAHLSGHGERAGWQIDAFEQIAAGARLHTRRTPPMRASPQRFAGIAAEFPLFAAAMRAQEAAQAGAGDVLPEVLWIHRDAALAEPIERLLAGDRSLLGTVLGYPACCAEHDGRSEFDALRALLRLYATEHGIHGEAAVLQAIAAGITVAGDPAASVELASVWRTRIAYPWVGHNACPHCVADGATSPSARLDHAFRELAFALDPAFARALWQAARGEAALATTGDCRALDPAGDDACPCGSDERFAACCAGQAAVLPEFR